MDKVEAHALGSTFSEVSQKLVFRNDRYMEVVGTFNEPGLARAQVASIHTPGIDLMQVSFNTKQKLVIVDPENAEVVSSTFILDGNLESKFKLNNSSVKHWGNTHAFQYIADFQGEHQIQDGKLKAIVLNYNNDYFKSIAESAGSRYLDKVLNSIARHETHIVPPGELFLQPRMAELLHAIDQCCFQGLTKYLFIEAKMLELLSLQLEQMQSASGVKDEWSPVDRERLKAVQDFIRQNYLEPLTLGDICLRFGLNEFKLKKGYKHFFGSTVFGHIYQLRMQAAKHLLVSGQMNVSEVSLHLGYNNISSFSEAFKKHFGYLPGVIKNHLAVL